MRGTMFGRLRLRLVAGNVVVIAAILAVLGAGVLAVLDQVLVAQQAQQLRAAARESLEELRLGEDEFRGRHAAFEAGTFYVLWDASGTMLLETAPIASDLLWPAARAARSGGPDQATVRLDGSDVLVVSTSVGSGLGGVIQVGRSLDPVRAAEGQVTLLLVIAGLAGLVLSVVAGWYLAERSLLPIRRSFERQRQFTADASHELRTPLAIVDAGLQVLDRHRDESIAQNRDTLAAMDAQVTRMRRLVAGLLTLARADAGAGELQRTETDVDALVRSTVEGFAPLAAEHGASLGPVETAAGTANVDRDRLRELLGILVDNAIVHGGPGVHVSVVARRSDGQVVIEVADDGPGIPAADRERVFERFVRGDASRPGDGTGLGLAIARWIATAHGGTLRLEENRPGLRAHLTLPA